MQHFFVEPEQITGNKIIITGEDVNHIKNVLRMKIGEEISVSNGVDDNEYRAGISQIGENEVVCDLLFVKEDGVELPVKITLFQGMPKADKMELIVQKAVELGVARVVPVETARAVVKLDDRKAKSRTERWMKISEAAAKQSKRACIPEVTLPMTMREAVEEAKHLDIAAIPYELAKGMGTMRDFVEKVKELAKSSGDGSIPPRTAGIFIGPEGGFTEEEVQLASDAGIVPVSLGRRILRTETAGMTVLSILMYETEI
ncbi:MAG: 16S rRNA (uracil(1498)-N(3))-methyltransferase [Lachnospiraceae bacterium]|nr:16S rRNA (uracil(1498)-N(3))-methyltransferase [Lachnospiraceae bacterium]